MKTPTRPWAALFALSAALAATGCLHLRADIAISPTGEVAVRERLVPDPDWRMEAGDSLGATAKLIRQYVEEATARGGEARAYGLDSATAVFRYPSLEAFVYAWPDTADNRSFWDRSLLRRVQMHGKACDELVLFRMSPPDPSKALPNQRYPVLSFTLTLPAPAESTNAHSRLGTTYAWRFAQTMAQVDSVWAVWPRPGSE